MHQTVMQEDVATRLRVISSLMECETLDSDARTFIQNTVLDAADVVEGKEGRKLKPEE